MGAAIEDNRIKEGMLGFTYNNKTEVDINIHERTKYSS